MLHYHVADPTRLDLRPNVEMQHPERVYARYADAAAEAARLRQDNDGHGYSVATCGTPPEWAAEVLLGDGTVRRLQRTGPMTSYRVAILWADGLTTSWTTDYTDRDTAIEDLRHRYAARADSTRRILTAAICPTGTQNAETVDIEQEQP